MLREFLLFLLLISSVCSAQVTTGGLAIPGDGAVQVVRSASSGPVAPSFTRDGLILELYAENYVKNGLGVPAVWTDMSGEGNDASQSVDALKPIAFTKTYGTAVGGNSINVYFATRPSNPTVILFSEITWNRSSTGYYVYGGVCENAQTISFQEYITSGAPQGEYLDQYGNFFHPATPYANLASTAIVVAVHATDYRRLIMQSDLDDYDESTTTPTLTASPLINMNVMGTTNPAISTTEDFTYAFLMYNRKLTDDEITGVIAHLKYKYGVPW